jgi:ATP-binding cassette, subfamily B, bacterial
VSRKIQYLNGFLYSRTAAKDMRLYNMINWLMSKQDAQFAESDAGNAKVARKRMNAKLISTGLTLLRDGAAYAFLIYLFFRGQITLGNFMFVFAAIGAFAGWVSGIITGANDLLRSSSEISDMRRYLDLADRMRTGPGHKLPQGAPPAISLRGVSYRYPEAESFALKDIDLEIAAGESIAIVGANGAGKTTLVKLLCGLYQPTEGEIRLDGIDIGDFNRDEYFTLFSTVFQDIHLLSSSISHNVSQALPQDTDEVRVAACLQMAGLWEKVQSLPEKADTLLVREVNADGLDLSGGEKQKLAMARALYKAAPVMILDEPTAALDPIAENQVYQQYAELTRGKTSVYISHRLASTRFCDRIVLLDGRQVKEVGTHDELMALGGLYAEMFSIQAHYYSSDMEAMQHAGA